MKDGDFTVYYVAHWHEEANEWCMSDCETILFSNVDYSDRALAPDELERLQRIIAPFKPTSECWQKTWIRGSFNKFEAMLLAEEVRNLRPKRKFAVMMRRVKQSTTAVLIFPIVGCNPPKI